MPRFYNRYDVLPRTAEIEDFEQEFNFKLPDDYKQHLLTYNGGLTYSICYFETKDLDDIYFESFHAFKKKKKNVLREWYLTFGKDLLPPDYLTIGYISGGHLAICLSQENYGAIYIFFSDVQLEKIADSFSDFKNGLRNEFLIGRSAKGMTYDSYDNLIQSENLQLPIAYRNFICGTNGGVPKPNAFIADSGKVYHIKCFFCLVDEAIYIEDVDGEDMYSSKLIMKVFRDEGDSLPSNFYPFANGEDYLTFCIQMDEKNFGAVYLLNLERANAEAEFVCHSFDYFLKNIEDSPTDS